MVTGQLTHELEVKAPASQVWELYSATLQLVKLLEGKLSHIIQKVDIVEGDGGVGTIASLKFAPEFGLSDSKEKVIKVDDENRLKETAMVEGGYLDLGFNSFKYRIHVLEKGKDSCIIKSDVVYDAKDENAAKYATVAAVENVALIIQKHVTKA